MMTEMDDDFRRDFRIFLRRMSSFGERLAEIDKRIRVVGDKIEDFHKYL